MSVVILLMGSRSQTSWVCPHEKVYKTLVTVGNSKNYFVFVLPIEGELDLKKQPVRWERNPLPCCM